VSTTLKFMPIPDYQSLMLPVFVASSKGEVRISAVVDELADQLKLTPEERSELLPSGKQTIFSNRVHWAKSYLSKAGLVELTRRAYFKVSPRGEDVLKSTPGHIDNRFLAQFEEFRSFSKRGYGATDDEESPAAVLIPEDHKQTPDETMRTAHRQIESTLAQDLLERVRSAPPEFFERLIVNLLLSMGYDGSRADKQVERSGAQAMMASTA
jgi:restriction system protein